MEDPPEEDRRSILNDVWKVVMKLKNPTVSLSYHYCNQKIDQRKFKLVECFTLSYWLINNIAS